MSVLILLLSFIWFLSAISNKPLLSANHTTILFLLHIPCYHINNFSNIKLYMPSRTTCAKLWKPCLCLSKFFHLSKSEHGRHLREVASDMGSNVFRIYCDRVSFRILHSWLDLRCYSYCSELPKEINISCTKDQRNFDQILWAHGEGFVSIYGSCPAINISHKSHYKEYNSEKRQNENVN